MPGCRLAGRYIGIFPSRSIARSESTLIGFPTSKGTARRARDLTKWSFRRFWAPLAGTILLSAAAVLMLFGARTPSGATGLGAIRVPAGFKVELAAGPELSSYPMMGTFDDRGRLFIAESSGNTLNDQQMKEHPDYKIRLLEDRNGDGVFDHSQVFADHLTLPAGAVWYRNSLYVAAPPDLLRFEDTN